jgi:hypothetical protein
MDQDRLSSALRISAIGRRIKPLGYLPSGNFGRFTGVVNRDRAARNG